jgi:hypothetical protein
VPFQTTRRSKTLLANIALVLRSLPLHSFLNTSRFFFSHLISLYDIVTRHAQNPPQSLSVVVFSLFFFFFLYLMMIRLEIVILIRNPQTQHRFFFFHFFFFSRQLQNRPRVHRAFRMWILSSAH